MKSILRFGVVLFLSAFATLLVYGFWSEGVELNVPLYGKLIAFLPPLVCVCYLARSQQRPVRQLVGWLAVGLLIPIAGLFNTFAPLFVVHGTLLSPIAAVAVLTGNFPW